GAEARGLDEAGEAEGVVDRLAVAQGDVSGDRDAAVAQYLLEEVLVHAQRRCCNAGADVGNSRQFQQPLDGAVLAEGAVEDREDDVDRAQSRRRVRGWNRQSLRDRAVARAELPAA